MRGIKQQAGTKLRLHILLWLQKVKKGRTLQAMVDRREEAGAGISCFKYVAYITQWTNLVNLCLKNRAYNFLICTGIIYILLQFLVICQNQWDIAAVLPVVSYGIPKLFPFCWFPSGSVPFFWFDRHLRKRYSEKWIKWMEAGYSQRWRTSFVNWKEALSSLSFSTRSNLTEGFYL